MIDQIQWLGHGSFAILSDPLIYINPWRVTRIPRPVDAILIGNEHYEYCSPADIEKLRGPNTQVIASARAAQQIENCTVLRPWQSISVGRACIKGIPAYSPRLGPPDEGGLGFVISVNYFDIYYAGQSGVIPEMGALHPDIAILPIDGKWHDDRLGSSAGRRTDASQMGHSLQLGLQCQRYKSSGCADFCPRSR